MNQLMRTLGHFRFTLRVSNRGLHPRGSRGFAATSKTDPFGYFGGKQADNYAAYRPKYTNEIIQTILNKLQERPDADQGKIALDLCTGTGQVAELIAPYFEKVIGLDRSTAQLQRTAKISELYPNCTFEQVEDVCHLPQFADESVSLITIAQALHWLDAPSCFEEANRLLQPGGVLSALGYGICSVTSSEEAESAFKQYYYEVLGSHLAPGSEGHFWDIDRRLVDNGLEGIDFGSYFDDVSKVWFKESKNLTLQQFLGYVSTFSGYGKYMESGHAREDPLLHLTSQLQAILLRERNEATSSVPFMITHEMKSRLGRLGYSDEDIRHLTPKDAHCRLAEGSAKKGQQQQQQQQPTKEEEARRVEELTLKVEFPYFCIVGKKQGQAEPFIDV